MVVEAPSGPFDDLPEEERAEPRVLRLPRLREADRCRVELRSLSLGDPVAADHRDRSVSDTAGEWAGSGWGGHEADEGGFPCRRGLVVRDPVGDAAVILAISNETVETHVRNAMRKLGALNKTHAAVLAMKLGQIDP